MDKVCILTHTHSLTHTHTHTHTLSLSHSLPQPPHLHLPCAGEFSLEDLLSDWSSLRESRSESAVLPSYQAKQEQEAADKPKEQESN